MQWSKIKKTLDSFLCKSLKNRVKYFATSYRKAHDEIGRVSILVDNEEIINSTYNAYVEAYVEAKLLVKVIYDEDREIWRNELEKEFDNAETELAKKGVLSTYYFSRSFDDITQKSISDCLNSENLLTKAMAIIDRRVGKRTLLKMKEQMESMPDWVKCFYQLRMDCEKINFNVKEDGYCDSESDSKIS